jgi:hypothetical protein
MDQEQVIKESFHALCINMELKDYGAASEILGLLACFQDKLTATQLDQLSLTWDRLEYIRERDNNDNQP